MTRGKHICKILKEIRKQIAETNDIEFVTSKCNYKGDCLGTCPKCEAEVRYLEQQLHARRLVGKAVTIAGISIGASSMLPLYSMAQEQPRFSELLGDVSVVENNEKTHVLSGKVFGMDRHNGLEGAVIHNLNTLKIVYADENGDFEIDVCPGDSVEFSYVGYLSKVIPVEDAIHLSVVLIPENVSEEVDIAPSVIMGLIPPPVQKYYQMDEKLYLRFVDENNNPMDLDMLYNVQIKRMQISMEGTTIIRSKDEFMSLPELLYVPDDNEDEKIRERLSNSKNKSQETENEKMITETTISIKAYGYEDVVISKAGVVEGIETIVLKRDSKR